MRELLKHISNWVEAYIWAPLILLSILGAAQFIYFVTGRRPEENMSWVMDYSSRSVLCVLIILFTAIYKQSNGSWMSLEQKLAHPGLAIWADVKILFSTLIFVYIYMK